MPKKQLTIDMHCHPSLKTWLFNSKFEINNLTFSKEFFPTDMRVDYPKLVKGNVDIIMSALYLVEHRLFTDCKNIRLLSRIIFYIFKNLKNKVEKSGSPDIAFQQTTKMLRHFEHKIRIAKSKGKKVEIARNYNELIEQLKKKNKVVLHTIEGAHSLGRKYNGVKPDYLKNLKAFFKKGVCMITLGHFYKNDFVWPVMGMPVSMVRKLGCRKHKDLTKGLTNEGEILVNHMLDLGIIVDLTHSTPKARKSIFDINESRGTEKRPIVFSHVGVQQYFYHPMNPSDEEILRIQDCNGVIGMIFNNYFQTGNEEHDFLPIDFTPEYGTNDIIKTIEHISKVTNSFDNIAIGSDLDGFTDPPDDLYNSSKFSGLRSALRNKFGRTAIQKIMGGNVLRVLKEGWGQKNKNKAQL